MFGVGVIVFSMLVSWWAQRVIVGVCGRLGISLLREVDRAVHFDGFFFSFLCNGIDCRGGVM